MLNKGLPIKYRKPLKCFVWVLSFSSVAISFCTLPPILAGVVSVIALIAPWIVSRIIFLHHSLWVMPSFSEDSERNRLGTIWFWEELKGKSLLGLGLLYEDFEYAKEAYNVLRSWNFGRFIDEEGNIQVSIIDEGDHRYSMFTYPGKRSQGEEQIKARVYAGHAENTAAFVSRLFQYTTTCANYSDRPEVEERLQDLKRLNTLLLNTYFCDGREIKPLAKRFFKLKRFRFLKRSDLTSKDLEFHVEWSDGRAMEPEKTKRVDELTRLMQSGSSIEKASVQQNGP